MYGIIHILNKQIDAFIETKDYAILLQAISTAYTLLALFQIRYGRGKVEFLEGVIEEFSYLTLLNEMEVEDKKINETIDRLKAEIERALKFINEGKLIEKDLKYRVSKTVKENKELFDELSKL